MCWRMEGGLRTGEGGPFDVKMKDRGCRYFCCRVDSLVIKLDCNWPAVTFPLLSLVETAHPRFGVRLRGGRDSAERGYCACSVNNSRDIVI